MSKTKPAAVTPKCCPEAQALHVVTLQLDPYCDTPTDEQEPYWHVTASNVAEWVRLNATVTKRGVMSVPELPRPQFCPFCGAALPKPVKKARPPKVMVVSDGGYRCDTCDKRLHACSCPLPQQAYRVPKH